MNRSYRSMHVCKVRACAFYAVPPMHTGMHSASSLAGVCGSRGTHFATPPLSVLQGPEQQQQQQQQQQQEVHSSSSAGHHPSNSYPGLLHPVVRTVPPSAGVSSRSRHSLTSSEEEHLFSKGRNGLLYLKSSLLHPLLVCPAGPGTP
jgi:hypothetical protein